jgi:uncharacterized protein
MVGMIVADAGPLIALAKIEQLPLLKVLFSEVRIPQTVFNETCADTTRADANAIRTFANAHATLHADREDALSKQLQMELDAGEAQAIALAQSLRCTLLIDDLLGRAVARRRGVPIVGVIGMLLQAKRMGHLTHVRPLLEALNAAQYRISTALFNEAIRLAGEA